MPKSVRQEIEVANRCPVCQAVYAPGSVRVLEQVTSFDLLHCSCPKCSVAAVSLVNFEAQPVGVFSLITDLAEQEILKYKSFPALDFDYCLNLYQILTN
jgi:hypothetical protein